MRCATDPAAQPNDTPAFSVQFYLDDAFLIETAATFVISGVDAGDSMIVIGTAEHLAALQHLLSAQTIPWRELVGAGRLALVEAQGTLEHFMDRGTLAPARFHQAIAALIDSARKASTTGRVRAFGEMADLLWRRGEQTAALALEQLWHQTVASERIGLMSAYGSSESGTGAPPGGREAGDHLERLLKGLVQAATAEDIARVGLEAVNAALNVRTGSLILVEGSGKSHTRVMAALRPLSPIRGRNRVCVPMSARGEIFGSMNLDFPESHELSAEERAFLQAVADHCALGLQRARMLDAERRERGRLSAEHRRALITREDFTAMITHDLRNLIGIVSMSAVAISRSLPPGPLAERHRTHAMTIERSIRRMDRLVRDLTDMGALLTGKLRVELRPEDVDSLLSLALEDLHLLAAFEAVRLEVETPAAPMTILCDRQRMSQILYNLVGNAIKSTPRGGSIVVACTKHDERALFSVRDTGAGIDPGQLSRIFDHPQSIEGAERRPGLGLFVARGIVEAHGGRIWAVSAENQGSCFFFTVPLGQES